MDLILEFSPFDLHMDSKGDLFFLKKKKIEVTFFHMQASNDVGGTSRKQ